MVYNTNIGRLVMSGTIFNVETFSFGLTVVPDFPGANALPADALVEELATIVATYFVAQQIDGDAVLETVKFNEIDVNGSYASNDETVAYEFNPGVATSINNPYPAQTALAISLTTNKRRGLAHAGRYYLPLPSAPLQNDGRITAAAALAYADAASGLINDLNDALGVGWQIGVASNVGAGAIEPVTGVRVGRVLDTIRSRRRSLPEEYQVSATAVG